MERCGQVTSDNTLPSLPSLPLSALPVPLCPACPLCPPCLSCPPCPSLPSLSLSALPVPPCPSVPSLSLSALCHDAQCCDGQSTGCFELFLLLHVGRVVLPVYHAMICCAVQSFAPSLGTLMCVPSPDISPHCAPCILTCGCHVARPGRAAPPPPGPPPHRHGIHVRRQR